MSFSLACLFSGKLAKPAEQSKGHQGFTEPEEVFKRQCYDSQAFMIPVCRVLLYCIGSLLILCFFIYRSLVITTLGSLSKFQLDIFLGAITQS